MLMYLIVNPRHDGKRNGYVKLAELTKDQPSHCSLTLLYNTTYINEEFTKRGFNEQKLLEIIEKAKTQWERALGRPLFRYAPEETHNTINFIIGDYSDLEPGHNGIARPLLFENSTVGGFSVAIYNEIFSRYKDYNGPDLAQLEYNDLYLTIMHELGHTIGLGHILSSGSVMNAGGVSGQKITNTPPYLTPDDISALKGFCSN